MSNTPDNNGHDNPKRKPSEAVNDADAGIANHVIVNEQGQPYSEANNPDTKKNDHLGEFVKRIGRPKSLNIILTAVIALSAISQTVISCNNNASTSRQVERMIDAANRVDDAAESFSRSASGINGGVSDAVGKLEVQAEAMDRSRVSSEANSAKALQATIDNFHLDQRAWVSVIEISGAPQKDAQWVVTVRVKNTGKTFARNFYLAAGVALNSERPSFADVDNSPNLSPASSKSLITPNGEYESHSLLTGPGSAHNYNNPTQTYINDLKAGKGRNFAYGKMTYTDIFGRHHWSTYCAFLDQELLWKNCPYHNEADTQ